MVAAAFDSLNSEQQRVLDDLAQCLRIDFGRDDNLNPVAVQAAVRRLYALLDLDPPHIIWCDGPFQLAVMPLLLQLLAFQHDEPQARGRTKKLGFDSVDARAVQLCRVLTKPHWAKAVHRLLSQMTVADISDLSSNSERPYQGLDELYERFSWSRCGISLAEPLRDLFSKCTQEAAAILFSAATLKLSTSLTSRLYTTPTDQVQRVKQTVGHILFQDEAMRLRDTPSTVFGAALGPVGGLYNRAQELHEQIAGTGFEEVLRACPAPVAQARFVHTERNLANDLTVNTAGIFAFGPYQPLWGAWASFSATCYAIISRALPERFPQQMRSTLSDLSTLLRSGFAYTPLSRAVFICKLPFVSLDDLHRLHGTDGPAMQFDDGYKIYALCGVPVRRELIEAPEQLTFQQIDRERNAELRRVLIERYGLINYVRDSGAGIKDRTEEGTLYLKQQAADEPIALVLVRNKTAEADGTFKEYFLRVPPSIRTVREAIAWTFGLSAEQYNPSVET